MGEELYNKISNDEYWKLSKIAIEIGSKEFYSVNRKIKTECDKIIDIINIDACELKRGFDQPIKDSIVANIRNFRYHANTIIIFKIPDEYYVLRLVTHELETGILQFKCDQFGGLMKCIENAFTLLYFNPENEKKIIGLSYIKLFESYSEGDYKKALFKIKDLIRKNKPSDEILSLVNKYASDDAEELDKLRIILNRVDKIYSMHTNYIFYNKRVIKTVKRRHTGDIENVEKQDLKKYYAFESNYKKPLVDFLKLQRSIYDEVIDLIDPNIDTIMVEFIFNKLFELLEWINNTGEEKREIIGNRYRNIDNNGIDNADNNAVSNIEKLNNLDFENEVEELKKLIKLGKSEVKKCINSI